MIKTTRTYRILFSLLFFASAFGVFAAGNAEQLLDKAADKYRKQKSVTVNYTINADGQAQTGSLTLAGDRFMLKLPQVASWYDGRTQWTYASGEVDMTTPSPEELQQINPFAIIKSFKKAYTAKLLNKSGAEQTIELTANSKRADISKAEITINTSTLFPTAIVFRMGNRRTVTIKITSVTPGQALPDSFFRFDPKKYPGVKVVDLR